MSYHISTYGYTHKMFGCKRTKLDFGKPYWKEKTKNAKVFWTLAFFVVPKFGVPKRIRTAVDGVKGRDSHFDRPCPTFTSIYISHSYFTFSLLKSRRLRLDFMPLVGHSVGQMKVAIFAVIKELMPILSCICGA